MESRLAAKTNENVEIRFVEKKNEILERRLGEKRNEKVEWRLSEKNITWSKAYEVERRMRRRKIDCVKRTRKPG